MDLFDQFNKPKPQRRRKKPQPKGPRYDDDFLDERSLGYHNGRSLHSSCHKGQQQQWKQLPQQQQQWKQWPQQQQQWQQQQWKQHQQQHTAPITECQYMDCHEAPTIDGKFCSMGHWGFHILLTETSGLYCMHPRCHEKRYGKKDRKEYFCSYDCQMDFLCRFR